jgi:hypothetical protein
MKRSSGLWSLVMGVGCLVFAGACAQQGVGSTGSGGSTSGSGGDTSTGSGGNSASGGNTGSGGNSASGGTTGSGGNTASGGTTGSGGAGGKPATGGTTGTGGSGGSAATCTAAQLVPQMASGFYWEGTCSGNVTATGRNCPFYANGVTSCVSGSTWDTTGTIKSQTMTVGCTAGQTYTVNFHVRGIMGTRCYTGGTIASTATPSPTGVNNTWYSGGAQYNNSIWNTYELHVSPVPSGKSSVYFANAFGTDTVNTSWCEKEATYEVDYSNSFSVVGGGTITWTIHDTNCQAQQNCGSDDKSTQCNMMRSLTVSDLSPPGTFAQPPTNSVNGKTYYPQWSYWTVTSVTSP